MTLTLDPELIGRASRDDYSYAERASNTRISVLKGRPRYRMNDDHPPINMQLSIDMTLRQFNTFQTFWYATGRGTKPFIMRLMLDDNVIYHSAIETYLVQPTGPWSATTVGPVGWIVSLQIEVPGRIDGMMPICDDIHGGQLAALATDDIYAGSASAPAVDIITPCHGVI